MGAVLSREQRVRQAHIWTLKETDFNDTCAMSGTDIRVFQKEHDESIFELDDVESPDARKRFTLPEKGNMLEFHVGTVRLFVNSEGHIILHDEALDTGASAED